MARSTSHQPCEVSLLVSLACFCPQRKRLKIQKQTRKFQRHYCAQNDVSTDTEWANEKISITQRQLDGAWGELSGHHCCHGPLQQPRESPTEASALTKLGPRSGLGWCLLISALRAPANPTAESGKHVPGNCQLLGWYQHLITQNISFSLCHSWNIRMCMTFNSS